MSTGDLKNNIKKLQSQLKAVKYSGKLDLDGIRDGSPTAFLPLYHYIFTSFSHRLNKDISNSNNELYGKSDLRFIEAVYKILRDIFSYKPPVTREQFFQSGFAERKVIMATDIVCQVHTLYGSPSAGSGYKLASRLDKKQQDIHAKVQGSMQDDHRASSKLRKVAGSKHGADLTEAIVLPRYVTSSSSGSAMYHDWRDRRDSQDSRRNSGPSTPTPTPTSIELSDSDIIILPEVQPKPSPRMGAGDSTNQMTMQFTQHITNALTMLNHQVGKISVALEKVETQIESRDSPRIRPQLPPATVANKLQMDTVVSKVILLENRMTLLENKVEDIQACCTILLQNSNNSNNNNSTNNNSNSPNENKSQSISSIVTRSEDVRRSAGSERVVPLPNEMHPDYIKAFSMPPAVADNVGGVNMALAQRNNFRNGSGSRERNVEILGAVDDDGCDADDNITIENVAAAEDDLCGTGSQITSDMKFMKALIGQNESELSLLREQENSTISTSQQGSPVHKNYNNYNIPKSNTTSYPSSHIQQSSQSAETNSRLDHHRFSPIHLQTDSSLVQFDDNSFIDVPCGGQDGRESRRVSSTPNKSDVDLDTSTLSRVNRIMQMMKETQQQFSNTS